MRDAASPGAPDARVRALLIDGAEPLAVESDEHVCVTRVADLPALDRALQTDRYDAAIVDARAAWATPAELHARLTALPVPEARSVIAVVGAGEEARWRAVLRDGIDAQLPRGQLHRLPAALARCRAHAARLLAGALTEHERIAEALRDSEAEFRALFELSAAGVAQVDPATGCYVRANQRFCEITGYGEEELRGLTFSDLTHPDDRERNAEAIGAVVRGEAERWDIEKRYVRADGGFVWVRVSGQLLRDAHGNAHRLIANAVDVTDQKRAERALIASRRQLQVVTDSAPVMLASCGADYRFRFVNRSYAARFAREPREIVGRTFEEIAGEEAFVQLKPHAERALAGERDEYDAEIPDAELGTRWVRCAYAPEHDDTGRVVGWVSAFLDITDRKRAEEALLETDRRKNEFLAVLGHELRNPLAPLRTGVALLGHAGSDPELLDSLRTMMERQLGHLIRLVDDLLDLSRISRGEVELQRERLDLHEVIDAAVELSRPAIVERRHRLVLHHAPVPLQLDGDFQRLTQIVGNLLVNAAKYTDPGGMIEVRTEAVDGRARVRVCDTGFGIPRDRLEHVFDMFTQVPEHRERTGGGGLGIGLALSRQLVALHGGHIEALSEGLGTGSEFVVELPLARTPAVRAAVDDRRAGRSPARRVLVVDDNVDAADSLCKLLELDGHDVRVAHGSRAALECVEAFAPDVVLLDIGLPELDGYEVARRIRAGARGPDVLLVALTGWAQDADKRRARDAGFDRHLTKPVDIGELEALIAAAPVR